MKIQREMVLDLVKQKAQPNLGQHVVKLGRFRIAENRYDLLFKVLDLYVGVCSEGIGAGGEMRNIISIFANE